MLKKICAVLTVGKTYQLRTYIAVNATGKVELLPLVRSPLWWGAVHFI